MIPRDPTPLNKTGLAIFPHCAVRAILERDLVALLRNLYGPGVGD
jgi:hypothetical protein